MTERIIAVAFLVISVVSLVVQTIALTRITQGRTEWGLAARGILRTAVCRVAASVLYVFLGIATLLFITAVEALLVFGVVQIMWQLNAIADVQLRRRLLRPATGRHRAAPSMLLRWWYGSVVFVAGCAAFALYLETRL